MEKENMGIQETENNEVTENVAAAVAEAADEVANLATEPPAQRCLNCQALLAAGQAFCPECGAAQKKSCPRCGAELQDSQVFCDKCGQRADGQAAQNVNSAINQFNMDLATQKKKNKILPIVIGGVCLVAVIAVVLFVKKGGGFNFEKEFADIASEDWCEIASDGSYMTLDTNPDDIDSDSYDFDYTAFFAANDAIERVNEELGFSDSLTEKMNKTTWSQGKQTDENEKFKVTWTFHPDKGLEVMYEKK